MNTIFVLIGLYLSLGLNPYILENIKDTKKEQIETFSTDPPPSEEPGETVDPND